MLDLDTMKEPKLPIMTTKSSESNNLILYSLHIRSTSEKERNNYNLKTIAFFRFKSEIYSWTET